MVDTTAPMGVVVVRAFNWEKGGRRECEGIQRFENLHVKEVKEQFGFESLTEENHKIIPICLFHLKG